MPPDGQYVSRALGIAGLLLGALPVAAATYDVDFSLTLQSEGIFVQTEIDPDAGSWVDVNAYRDPALYGAADAFTAFGLAPGQSLDASLAWSGVQDFSLTLDGAPGYTWTSAFPTPGDGTSGLPRFLLGGNIFSLTLDFDAGQAVYTDDRAGLLRSDAGLPLFYGGYTSVFAIERAPLLDAPVTPGTLPGDTVIPAPLPAAWIMVLGALAILGLLRRRPSVA